jgi:hypothetical protein
MSEPIITQADIDLCKGSGELMRCPFCGSHVVSYGTKINRGTRWQVECDKTVSSKNKCTASIYATDEDHKVARAKAVEMWNRRAK